jgi:Protein of unknown function (DUF2911)
MTVQNVLILILCCGLFNICQGQEVPDPRPSPLAIAAVRYKDTYLKITYGQPHKNEREIFGTLVPFGQVWRTGANEATEITATADLMVQGKELKAGTYSLFSIPEKDHWTVIINSDVGQWGSYNYNPKLDVMRLDLPVQSVSPTVFEPFTITIEQKNEIADIVLLWDRTKISIPIHFNEPKPH